MPEPLIIGNVVMSFNSLPSTNSFANDLLKNQNIHEGAVIWAKEQTEGRGQMGTKWHSSAGSSLTCSIVLRPVFLGAENQFLLNMAVSLGVHGFMREAGIPAAAVKWPNDVYIGGRKAGGILIENTLSGRKITASVIGIGLNLNNVDVSGSQPGATSLAEWSGKFYDPETVLKQICSHLDREYLLLRSGKTADMKQRYMESLIGVREPVAIRMNGIIYRIRVTDVLASGRLAIRKENGEELQLGFKEAEWLPDETS